MNSLQSIQSWLHEQAYGDITQSSPVSGGSICDSFHVITDNNYELFIKTHNNAPQGFFAAEAAGLNAIAKTKTIKTPSVYHHTDSLLVLEYIPPGQQTEHYWETFAQKLAAMHQHHQPHFGFAINNYCGITPQLNPKYKNGHTFFIEQRILFQAKLAYQRKRIPKKTYFAIEQLCEKLPDLIPKQPASLIHGDLWSGNAYCGPKNAPMLIDPACYWGWAEAEIAMTHLFGGFPTCFYHAYNDVFAFSPGFEQRIPLYNLYHILNHVNIFGESYLSKVTKIIKCYL